ncbi:MAG TPA: FAD-binding oxidoreductase [Actinomycetes bacterium]|jgi:sarcosine oxidase subunit beta|nr:FAD-binding oxidoreductase [Actinomycetes bacterium]
MAGSRVVVVGGGVMGCSIAFHLAERGVGVLVLERGTVCSGMTARSGALVRMHYTNQPEARMALAGLAYFQEWRERVGGWCGFTVTGFVTLVGPDDAERLRRNVAMLRAIGVRTEVVEPVDLAAEHPELDLHGVGLAAVEPASGYADPVATTFAFASRAVDLGARIRQGVRALAIRTMGGRVTGLDTSEGEVGADAVVLACGPWVDPLARTAGFDLGITPERAQIAFLRRPEAARRHPMVIDGVLGTYFRPHGGELSLLGVEAGHHIDAGAVERELEGYDHGAVRPALARLARRVPSFAGAGFVRGHRGIYDTSPDGRAVLDRAPGVEGLYLAGGFSGTGFKKSPAVGACMAELIVDGRADTVDITPFRLSRFAEGQPIQGDEYHIPAEFGHRL